MRYGGKPDTQNPKPKTHMHPPFLGPIDIEIPSLDILVYCHHPKFFSSEIPSEIFPNESDIESLEYFDDLDWEPKIPSPEIVPEIFSSGNFSPMEFGGKFYGVTDA